MEVCQATVVLVILMTWGVGIIHSSNFWSYFVFTQQWPMAACIDGNATKHVCLIPANVTTWTVHGLWPSDPNSHEGPANCNASWKFDERKILTLEVFLRKFWPNLYAESEPSNFWAHEWDKHGTCSTNLPATANEHLYFSQGLLLNEYYNLTSLFEKNNLFPGKEYSLQEFKDAISETYAHEPAIQCVMKKEPEKEEMQYIYQIEFCLDKKFHIIDCPKHHHNMTQVLSKSTFSAIETGICSSHKPVQYLTIKHS